MMKKNSELKVLGIDLGASSGRGILGSFDGERLKLDEISRFINTPVTTRGMLCWDFPALLRDVRAAAEAGAAGGALFAGIDTWGVDYGYISREGELLAPPAHYRDGRTDGIRDYFERSMPGDRLYGITGIPCQSR